MRILQLKKIIYLNLSNNIALIYYHLFISIHLSVVVISVVYYFIIIVGGVVLKEGYGQVDGHVPR